MRETTNKARKGEKGGVLAIREKTYLIHGLHCVFHLMEPPLRAPYRDVCVVLVAMHLVLEHVESKNSFCHKNVIFSSSKAPT